MEDKTVTLREQTKNFLEEMGANNVDLSYISDDAYNDLTGEAESYADVDKAVQSYLGYNLIWDTDRLVWNIRCGLPNRIYASRASIMGIRVTNDSCGTSQWCEITTA